MKNALCNVNDRFDVIRLTPPPFRTGNPNTHATLLRNKQCVAVWRSVRLGAKLNRLAIVGLTVVGWLERKGHVREGGRGSTGVSNWHNGAPSKILIYGPDERHHRLGTLVKQPMACATLTCETGADAKAERAPRRGDGTMTTCTSNRTRTHPDAQKHRSAWRSASAQYQ